MMSIPANNLKLAVEMATRVETAMAKRVVGDQPEVRWRRSELGFFTKRS